MSMITEVRVEQLSPSSFRPFGQIIGQFDGTPSYAASSLKLGGSTTTSRDRPIFCSSTMNMGLSNVNPSNAIST